MKEEDAEVCASTHEGMIECIDERTGARTWVIDTPNEDIDIGDDNDNDGDYDDDDDDEDDNVTQDRDVDREKIVQPLKPDSSTHGERLRCALISYFLTRSSHLIVIVVIIEINLCYSEMKVRLGKS